MLSPAPVLGATLFFKQLDLNEERNWLVFLAAPATKTHLTKVPKGQLSLSMIFFFPMEEEEGIIYLKMTGTFLAWGHYSTCSLFFKDILFFFFSSHQISNLRLFIVFSFSSQALTNHRKEKVCNLSSETSQPSITFPN